MPIQIETFEWLHVWSEPRISILYDSHIDESWSDIGREQFDKKKTLLGKEIFKNSKKKSLTLEGYCHPMNDVKMTSYAAQPPNFLVSVGMDLHPVVVRLRLAGPLCNGGKLARCAFVAGFCTIPLNILCGLSSCNKAFFLLQGNQSHKLCIHDLR